MSMEYDSTEYLVKKVISENKKLFQSKNHLPFQTSGTTVVWQPHINTLRPRQNARHFPDDILKWIFLNENVWISIEISLKFVPKGPINNIPPLVQIMAWRWLGDKPLSEPMMVSLLTHICVTRLQWVKQLWVRVHTKQAIYHHVCVY